MNYEDSFDEPIFELTSEELEQIDIQLKKLESLFPAKKVISFEERKKLIIETLNQQWSMCIDGLDEDWFFHHNQSLNQFRFTAQGNEQFYFTFDDDCLIEAKIIDNNITIKDIGGKLHEISLYRTVEQCFPECLYNVALDE